MITFLYIIAAIVFVPYMGTNSLGFFVGFFALIFSIIGVIRSLDN